MSTAQQRQKEKGRLKAPSLAVLAHERREQERLARIAEELAVIAEDKKRKTAAGKRKVGDVVIRENDRDEQGNAIVTNRSVKKYLTTLDQLEKRGQLEKHLRNAFDELARSVALASGAACDERDLRGSSSKRISQWDSPRGADFGTRSESDQAMRAERLRQYVMGMIPEGMMKLASHLLDEETGYALHRPPPLVEYGNDNGFNQEQQARSSGATMAIDICRVIHHALKSR